MMSKLGLGQSDHIIQMMTLIMITLSKFHYIYNSLVVLNTINAVLATFGLICDSGTSP
jgi:hypothetical protein